MFSVTNTCSIIWSAEVCLVYGRIVTDRCSRNLSPSCKLLIPESNSWFFFFIIIGFGVFASREFYKGDFLLEYCGEHVNKAEADEREQKGNCFLFGFKFAGKFQWYVKIISNCSVYKMTMYFLLKPWKLQVDILCLVKIRLDRLSMSKGKAFDH